MLQSDDGIIIKGSREGLLITLGPGAWHNALGSLETRLTAAPDFFKGARVALLAGCGPSFREKFEYIKVGADSREDVREILGKPKFRTADQWVYDKPKHRTAIIYFDADGNEIPLPVDRTSNPDAIAAIRTIRTRVVALSRDQDPQSGLRPAMTLQINDSVSQ